MAKISARGCHKVAGASRKHDSQTGATVRIRLVLRSDGKVLRAIDVHHSTGYPSRGGFSIIGTFPRKDRAEAVWRDAFHQWAENRGYSVDRLTYSR